MRTEVDRNACSTPPRDYFSKPLTMKRLRHGLPLGSVKVLSARTL